MELNVFYDSFKLPKTVYQMGQIRLLKFDLASLIDQLDSLQNQELVTKDKLKVNHLLLELLEFNNLDYTKRSDLILLQGALESLESQAQILHFSFNQRPRPEFIYTLVEWLRGNIGPKILISVGYNPSLGLGFTIRTDNKYFDFSLAKRFSSHHQELVNLIREVTET
jgi:hypothetical protein